MFGIEDKYTLMEYNFYTFPWNILLCPSQAKFLTTLWRKAELYLGWYTNLNGELSQEVSIKSEVVLIILYLIFKKLYSLDILSSGTMDTSYSTTILDKWENM